MDWSQFGRKFTDKTGILELMDDLGTAMAGQERVSMLGGGNPAVIPEVSAVWRREMASLLERPDEFDRMLSHYDTPQGKTVFLEALADLFRRNYGWEVGPENIAVTNGSQSAFFLLFNMLSGSYGADSAGRAREGKILFPLMPEYIGYADQSLGPDHYRAFRPEIRELEYPFFKYHVDFDRLRVDEDVKALCVSRPTNPTGNVLTDEEVQRLSGIAADRGIPLLLDNAYGTPFPHIIFEQAEPIWNENIILGMSLSKIGLPGVRTGIVVARPEVVEALSAVNAIMSLANGTIGQVLTLDLVRSGEILKISRDMVRPFYREKARQAVGWIREFMDGRVDYRLHRNEGSIFLWIWLRNLSISSKELYRRLKKRGVIVVPGEYFFYGLGEEWDHREQCLRLNYAQGAEDVRRGLRIIAEEADRAQV